MYLTRGEYSQSILLREVELMYLTTRSTADVSLKGKNSKCILLREVQHAVPSSSG